MAYSKTFIDFQKVLFLSSLTQLSPVNQTLGFFFFSFVFGQNCRLFDSGGYHGIMFNPPTTISRLEKAIAISRHVQSSFATEWGQVRIEFDATMNHSGNSDSVPFQVD